MLSKEDTRRLAQLERQLRRDDPEFCDRMAGAKARRRVSISLLCAGAVVWAAALVLAVVGWWAAAIVSGVWAIVIMVAIVYRARTPKTPVVPDTLPPHWS
jgi:Flp pilus assembly protein TadB